MRSRTIALRFVLVIMLAFSLASVGTLGVASADEQGQSQDEAASSKVIRVGYLIDNQDYQSGTPDTYMSGWGYEYLQDISYHTEGWKYEYVRGRSPSSLPSMRRGKSTSCRTSPILPNEPRTFSTRRTLRARSALHLREARSRRSYRRRPCGFARKDDRREPRCLTNHGGQGMACRAWYRRHVQGLRHGR